VARRKPATNVASSRSFGGEGDMRLAFSVCCPWGARHAARRVAGGRA
jgi:hypothetical protein